MLRKILAILAGFIAAFAIMMAFEFVNSLIFPFPEGMDYKSLDEVRQFTETLPSTAFIMVLLGWAIGAFVAVLVTMKISRKSGIMLPLIVGIILTICGVVNVIMFQHPLWFNIVGLPLFIIFTILAWRMNEN